MNILIIQENGRHEGNREFRECFCLKRAFEKYNHHVTVWGLGHANYLTNLNFNLYDLIINLENYDQVNWVPNLYDYTKPIKILWSIDAHCRGEEIFEKTFTQGRYNYLLHSTKDYVKKDYHIWFPNAYDDDLIFPIENIKKYDLGFCGNFVTERRKLFIETIDSSIGLKKDIFVIGRKMVEAINSYRIHVNLNIANDINYRSFETIGCKTVLFTNYNNQYKDLGFEDMKNCVIYHDLEEAITKLKAVVKEKDLINFISKNAYDLSRYHTYKNRVKKILNLI